MNEEFINKLLRDSINLILNEPEYAVRAKQSGAPRKTGPYASVDLLTSLSVGYEQRELTNAGQDLESSISGSYLLTYSINFHRDSALDNGFKIRTLLFSDQIKELFKVAGVGLVSRSEVRNLTSVIDSNWEERAQFDITVNAINTDTETLISVLSVTIPAEFQNSGIVYNQTIEVP